jgi:hypothetical protein
MRAGFFMLVQYLQQDLLVGIVFADGIAQAVVKKARGAPAKLPHSLVTPYPTA